MKKKYTLIKYIFPYIYTFRFNRPNKEGVAFFLEYHLLLYFIIYTYYSLQKNFLLLELLLLTSYTLIYEVGYIENNVRAIKKEENPTIRHQEDELKYLQKNFFFIEIIRWIESILILYIGIKSNIIKLKVSIFFVMLCLITRGVYYFYNFIYRKGILNRLLFFLLRYLRYYTPILFLNFNSFKIALIISILNFINNFSWYKRTTISLPKLFGTKLFDLFYYVIIYLIVENYELKKIFNYLIIIKIILIIYIYPSKLKNKKGVNKLEKIRK